MKLADEIKAMQQSIDKDWLRQTILQWFEVRKECQSVVLYTSNAIKEPQKKLMTSYGKTFIDRIEIPSAWTSRVINWAIQEGFYPELCRGELNLKLSNI